MEFTTEQLREATDGQLNFLSVEILDEQRRRETLATVKDRAIALAQEYEAAVGREIGDPGEVWQEISGTTAPRE